MSNVLRRIRVRVWLAVFVVLSVDRRCFGGWVCQRLFVAVCRWAGVAKRARGRDVDGGRYAPQIRRHIELAALVGATVAEKGARILDVGCGPGWLIARLRNAGYANVSGCDWTERDDADFDYTQVDLNVDGLRPYTDQSFDAVIASDVLEHLENPAAALREMTRVLVPGGHLFITLPSCWNVYERTLFFLTGNSSRYKVERPDRQHSHISMLPSHVLINLTKRAGLRLVDMRSGFAFLFGHFWDGLKHPLFAYNLMYHYVRQEGAA